MLLKLKTRIIKSIQNLYLRNTYHGFEEIDDEEPINEDLYESSLPKQSRPKENPMFTSSEDFLAS